MESHIMIQIIKACLIKQDSLSKNLHITFGVSKFQNSESNQNFKAINTNIYIIID